MQSKRNKKRKGKGKAHGSVKPIHKRFSKEKKMNAAGFYDGMPGCTLDEFGNRKMIEFVIRPDGYHTTRLFAHPQYMKKAIEGAMKSNNEIKGIVQGAAIDIIFQEKNLLNYLIRWGLLRRRKKAYRKFQKQEAERIKNEQLEDGKTEENQKT